MDEIRAVAADASRAGGAYLAERFEEGLDAEYSAVDVKTAADRESERRVLEVLEARRPDDAVSTEESGHHAGTGPYRWVVDPLDGTNNFAAGVPTFGVAVTAVEHDAGADAWTDSPAIDGTPLATAVHVPVLDDLYVARRNGGVTYEGAPVGVGDGDTLDPAHATVAIVPGLPVIESEDLSATYADLRAAVEGEVKRAIPTWAPVVHWALLARGRLDGFVAFHPDEREQAAGELLAREAGAVRRVAGPLTVFGADERTATALFAAASGAI